eukprot:jgi/Mesvir1/13284/Mv25762-RA.1
MRATSCVPLARRAMMGCDISGEGFYHNRENIFIPVEARAKLRGVPLASHAVHDLHDVEVLGVDVQGAGGGGSAHPLEHELDVIEPRHVDGAGGLPGVGLHGEGDHVDVTVLVHALVKLVGDHVVEVDGVPAVRVHVLGVEDEVGRGEEVPLSERGGDVLEGPVPLVVVLEVFGPPLVRAVEEDELFGGVVELEVDHDLVGVGAQELLVVLVLGDEVLVRVDRELAALEVVQVDVAADELGGEAGRSGDPRGAVVGGRRVGCGRELVLEGDDGILDLKHLV